MREALDGLGRLPDFLSGVRTVSHRPTVEHVPSKPGRILQNKNVTQQVREFIDTFGERNKVIPPKDVVEYLTSKGVVGKPRSLYSSVCVILKKETQPTTNDKARLIYEKGRGFRKPS